LKNLDKNLDNCRLQVYPLIKETNVTRKDGKELVIC